MPTPRVNLVVAHDRNRVIGVNGGLPWRLPADLRHFRAITMGKPIVMGRRTYESIGRPLPGRTNIIVSSSADFAPPGVVVREELNSALDYASTLHEDIMVIGGAALYAGTIGRADRIYLTEVHAEVAGDVYFPEYRTMEWLEIDRKEFPVDAEHVYPYAFVELQRCRQPVP